MRSSGSGSRVRRALAAGALLIAAAAGAAGQTDAPRVVSVAVQVEGETSSAELEGLIRIAPGDPFVPALVDETVKEIHRTGLFADIEVLAEGESEVRLTFVLRRKLFTRTMSFTGETGIPRKSLRDGLYALRPDTDYTDQRLRRAEEELLELLRRNGFFTASVTGTAVRDPTRPLVDVSFAIEPGPRFVVRSVEFRGTDEKDQAELRRVMATRPGRPYIPAKLEADLEALKALYDARGLPRAEVAVQNRLFRESDGTIGLVLRVVPNELVRISVRGADVPAALLRPIWEERVFEDWGLAQAEARILSEVRKKGFVWATVRSTVEKGDGEIHIIHDVDAGRRFRIRDVVFQGLTEFDEIELRQVLGLPPRISLLGGPSGDRLFEIPSRIEELYKDRGYPGARVSFQFTSEDDQVRAVYLVEEGPRETVERLDFRGLSAVTKDELVEAIETRSGGPYTAARIRRDVERLEAWYRDRGFRGTTVEATTEEADEGRHQVTFDVREGRSTRIERIIVAGNSATRRDVIDRALLVREGDEARSGLLLESKRRLERLGVFSEVRIEEIPAGDGVLNLVVSVREGERNYVGVGVGLETKNEPMTFVLWNNVLRPRFTAEFIRSNMFGRASQLSLVGQFSLKEKRAVISYEAPTFFGLGYQTSVNVWLEREARVSYGFDRRGVSLSGYRPIGLGWTSLTTVRWASTTLYFLETEESEVDRQHFPFSATSVSESLIWDVRDDSFNPSRGHFFSAVVEWAYPVFNAESDYLKTFLKAQKFWPVGDRVLALVTGRVGLAMGRVPIHERFFGGGSSSFRGRPFDQLGPLDPVSENPVGGKALAIFNFELQARPFPTLPDLAAAVFYDKGNCFSHRKDVSLGALEDALGFGVRYRTPLGPLRIDLGWNLRPPEGRRQPLIYVTIGNVF